MSFLHSTLRGVRFSPVAALIVTVGFANPALGQGTSMISTDGLIKVDLKPITPLGSGSFSTGLFSGFPGWTVNQGTGPGGTLTTSNYAPKILYDGAGHVTGGGATINATYTHPTAPSAANRFQYIQVASTTGFGPAYATPHLDPLNNDDALPFYWTSSEAAANRNASGSQVRFSDMPQAPFAGLANGPVSFKGDLFVSEWDGATGVTVDNGFSWGYDMSLATNGKATGTFSNPSPTCPPATCTGTNTNTFTWGTGSSSPPSSLTFTGTNFTPVIGTKFVIGNLSYFNGAIVSGTGVDLLDFGADIFFGFGSNFGTPFHLGGKLSLINTPNLGVDPVVDADFVSFISSDFTANFNVFEGGSASVPLYAQLLSNADVVAEKQLGDASFTGFRLAFAGFGDVSGQGFITSVPEPSSLTLLASGLLLVVAMRSRSRRRSNMDS